MKFNKKIYFKLLYKYFNPINYIRYIFRISFFLTNINIFHNKLPEVSTIHFFLKKMKQGSIILLDDYAFANAKLQREIINKYFDKLKLSRPLTLPTGQGIYIL